MIYLRQKRLKLQFLEVVVDPLVHASRPEQSHLLRDCGTHFVRVCLLYQVGFEQLSLGTHGVMGWW